MDISTLMNTMGIHNFLVRERAQEYMRLSNVRLGRFGEGQLEMWRRAACIELACRCFNEQCDRKKLCRLANASIRQYTMALRSLEYILEEHHKHHSMESLCLRFGCPELDRITRNLLEEYKKIYIGKIKRFGNGTTGDFCRLEFKIAALYICSKHHKISINKKGLLSMLSVSQQQFQKICNSIEEECHDLILSYKVKDGEKNGLNKDDNKKIDFNKEKKQIREPLYESKVTDSYRNSHMKESSVKHATLVSYGNSKMVSLLKRKKSIMSLESKKLKENEHKNNKDPIDDQHPKDPSMEKYLDWREKTLTFMKLKKQQQHEQQQVELLQ